MLPAEVPYTLLEPWHPFDSKVPPTQPPRRSLVSRQVRPDRRRQTILTTPARAVGETSILVVLRVKVHEAEDVFRDAARAELLAVAGAGAGAIEAAVQVAAHYDAVRAEDGIVSL